MKIDTAELRIIRLRLIHPFETSFGVEIERTIPILTLFTSGLEGYAEGVMETLPLYREEFVAGAVPLLKDVFIPRILRQDLSDPGDVTNRLAAFRGNRMAKSMVEMAFWDLLAKSQNRPLCQLLGGDRDQIPVGVSLGIQKSFSETRDQIQKHLDQGYQRVKLKIKPGWDVDLIRDVRGAFPNAVLTVDANSCYTLEDLPVLQELDRYGLDYIEQPLAYDDLIDHSKIQARLNTPICLDESILSAEDVRKALEIGAGRVINIKVGRVGGHLEAIRIHDLAHSKGVPVWCGGMLESGIGRAHNIHLATLANFSKPGDTSSSSRYWHRDIILESLEASQGWMPVPKGPGIGVHVDWEFLKSSTVYRELIRP